jgi:predicted dehydrogenase
MADVAVLGAGSWGQNLIRSMLEVKGVGRIYCVDPRPGLRQDLERRFGAATVLDRADDLIDDPRVKAAVIATPAASHYTLARRWIMAGKHVLVEKPVALDVAAAEDLTSLAGQLGVALLPGHTYYFNGARRTGRAALAGERAHESRTFPVRC